MMRPSLATARRNTGLWLALGTAGISGAAIFLNGYGVRAVGNPTAYTTAKNLVSAVMLLAVTAVLARQGRRPLTRPASLGQWVRLSVIGVIGGSVPFVLFFEGLARESSSNAAFLQKTLVVWVAMLAIPTLGERLGILQVLAVGLLLVGQAAATGSISGLVHMPFGSGETLVLVATLLWAVEVIVAKRVLADLSSWTVGVARMTLGSVLLIVWSVGHGDASTLTSLGARQWGWIVLTGCILAAYVATWFAALARAQAVDVTAVLVVGAVITAALSAVVQHQPLRPQLGGLGLVVLGAALIAATMALDARRRTAQVA